MADTRRRRPPKRRRQQRRYDAAKPQATAARHDGMALLRDAAEGLAHPCEAPQPPWKYLPLVLALALAARVAIALCGDFLLHPDEIMQYLEPAHRLAFGNGVVHWEYFYGARSWLMPGLIAVLLYLFKLLGLGTPLWYTSGVEIFFCIISLLIPVGMYFFARRHFSELTARIALLAGAFWYELVGFAHKSMTEFVATALLLSLLMLCMRPAADRKRVLWPLAGLAVLTAAIRVQYAPLALLLLGLAFLRSGKKLQLTFAASLFLLAVGVFDAVTWNGGLFHSYLTNIRFNFSYSFGDLPYAMPAYQFLWWLVLAACGLSGVCLVAALGQLRRYGLLLALIALLVFLHSALTHKEYRFVFVVLPLWLMIGADLLANLLTRVQRPRLLAGGAATLFTVISVAGILNALPAQQRVYQTPFIAHNEFTKFIPSLHSVAPIYSAYLYLAEAPGVSAVWHSNEYYSSTPGYYYLHRKVPFYDHTIGDLIGTKLTDLQASVSHIVSTSTPSIPPGYSLVKTFGAIHILQRDPDAPPARQWQEYVPHSVNPNVTTVLHQFGISKRNPPPNKGIRFISAAPPTPTQTPPDAAKPPG